MRPPARWRWAIWPRSAPSRAFSHAWQGEGKRILPPRPKFPVYKRGRAGEFLGTIKAAVTGVFRSARKGTGRGNFPLIKGSIAQPAQRHARPGGDLPRVKELDAPQREAHTLNSLIATACRKTCRRSGRGA